MASTSRSTIELNGQTSRPPVEAAAGARSLFRAESIDLTGDDGDIYDAPPPPKKQRKPPAPKVSLAGAVRDQKAVH